MKKILAFLLIPRVSIITFVVFVLTFTTSMVVLEPEWVHWTAGAISIVVALPAIVASGNLIRIRSEC